MQERFHSPYKRTLSLFGIFFCLLGGAFLIFIGHGFPPTSWILFLQTLPQASHLLTAHNATISLLLILLAVQALLMLTAWMALIYTLTTLLLFLLTSPREASLSINHTDTYPDEVELPTEHPIVKQDPPRKLLMPRSFEKHDVPIAQPQSDESHSPSLPEEQKDDHSLPQSEEAKKIEQAAMAGNNTAQHQESNTNPFESEPLPSTLVKSMFTLKTKPLSPEMRSPSPKTKPLNSEIKPEFRGTFAPLLVGARSIMGEKVPVAPRTERLYCQQWSLQSHDTPTYCGIFLLLDCRFTNPAEHAFFPADPQLVFWQQKLCNTMLNSLIDKLIPALFSISQRGEMEDFFSQTVARILAEANIAYPWRQVPSLIAVLRFAETLSVINIGKGSCYLIEESSHVDHTEDYFQYNPGKQIAVASKETGRAYATKLIVSSRPVVLSMSKGQTLLYCSEGLSNALEEQQRLQIVYTHREDPALAAQEVIEQARLNQPDMTGSVIILHSASELASTDQGQGK